MNDPAHPQTITPMIVTDRFVGTDDLVYIEPLRLTIVDDPHGTGDLTAEVVDLDGFVLANGVWRGGWDQADLDDLIQRTVEGIVGHLRGGEMWLGCGWAYHSKPEPVTLTGRLRGGFDAVVYEVRSAFFRVVGPVLWPILGLPSPRRVRKEREQIRALGPSSDF